MLVLLRDLAADEALEFVYNIDPNSDAPLDKAVTAWVDAGCPIDEPEEEP